MLAQGLNAGTITGLALASEVAGEVTHEALGASV